LTHVAEPDQKNLLAGAHASLRAHSLRIIADASVRAARGPGSTVGKRVDRLP
jgi:hypothetical protein